MCKKLIRCKESSTSGLIRHLASQHKNIDVPSSSKKQPTIDVDDDTESENAPPPPPKKPKIQSSILKYTKRQKMGEIVPRLATVDGFSIDGICRSSFIRESLLARMVLNINFQ